MAFTFMALQDLLAFQNPETVAIALGLLAFLFSFTILSRTLERGSSVLVSLAIGLMVAFFLYREELVLGRETLAVVLIIGALFVVFRIVRSFSRFGRHQFR